MAMQNFVCPQCGAWFRADPDRLEQSFPCPSCMALLALNMEGQPELWEESQQALEQLFSMYF